MTPHTFDWNTLYLTCFVMGLALSVLSFFTGALHLHIGHLHFGGHHHLSAKAVHGGSGAHHVSWLNAFTITGFLCWFGGAGYIFNRYSGFLPVIVFLFATVCGLAGAGILLWFFAGVLMKAERTLEAADTELVGMLGRISQPISANGVGEMLYTQNGSRRSVAVRSQDGEAIPRDTEVVVMSFSRGIARVRRWTDFEHGLLSGDDAAPQTGELREP